MNGKKRYKRRGPRVKKNKKQMMKQSLTGIVMVVAMIVFAVSAFQLYKIYNGYHKGEKEYNEIAQLAIMTTDDKTEEGEKEFRIDFDALREINEDVIGWIRFEEPKIINYPLVQGKDNSEYLHKTFKGYDNTVGTLFIDQGNQPDFNDRHTLIYGHYMYNGTMFNDLDSYAERSFWEKYPYFWVYTPDGREIKYQVYSAGIISDMADNYIYRFANNEEFINFLNVTIDSSNYDTGVNLDVDSKILTLSTCTKANNDERFVVHAVKVEERSMNDES